MPPLSSEILFTEQQSFLRAWWWLILLLVAALAVASLVLSRTGVPSVIKPLPLLAPLFLVGLFGWLRLDTRLDAQGISYRMRPLGQQRVAWADVRHAYVRQYSPIGEYGGWGIRGIFTKNRALNVAGSQGLQLELVDGRRLLLGTQHPEELQRVLAALHLPAAR